MTKTLAILIALGALTLVGCGASDQKSESAAPQRATPDAPAEVQPAADGKDLALAKTLPMPERVGQLIITKLDGTTLSDVEQRELTEQHIGGVILFAYNYESRAQFRRLNSSVQTMAKSANAANLGAIVSIDQEGGFVRRITDLPPERGQRELGQLNDPALTRRTAGASARGLRGVGINLNLAPVADLSVGPKRVMGERAYGAEPEQVSEQVAAAVEGSEENGVATSPKHFPGFGGASINSDFGIANIGRTEAQLADDLKPFEAAVKAGAATIMVSHGIYKPYDPNRPASLSKPIVTGILRDQLGYEGVAMTDSLNASGLRGAWKSTVPRACVAAVEAGIDLLLLTGSLETARLCRQRVTRAVYSGQISEKRINEAAARVIALKRSVGLVPTS